MKMIENWTEHLWKAWSVRLTTFWALLLTYFATYPDQWQAIMGSLPEPVRPFAGFAMGFAMWTTTAGSRVVVQKSLTKPGGE